MKKKINIVFSEIKKGENLDLYIIIFLAIIVAVLGISQTVSFEVISAVILATLGLLATSLLTNRHSSDEIQHTTSQLKSEIHDLRSEIHTSARLSDVFIKGYPDFSNEIVEAKRVSIEGAVLSGTLTRYSAQFIKFLQRGGSIRFLVSEPTPEVGVMQAFRSSLIKDIDFMYTTAQNSLETMKAMKSNAKNPLGVQIKMMPYLAPYSLVIIERNDGVKKIYARVSAFQVPASEQPVFQADNQTDNVWFEFFNNQFEQLWKASKDTDK